MDVSNDNVSSTDDITAKAMALTSSIGGVILLENSFFLMFLAFLLHKMRMKREMNDILMHFTFVCVNDNLSGLVLLAQGLTEVTGIESARLCAYVGLLSLSLNSMSQGNIACICAQRYIGARNIRKLTSSRQVTRTASLLIVNILICGTSYFASVIRMKIPENFPRNVFCSTVSVLVGSLNYMLIYYLIAIVFTVIADVLCVMTIWKLKKEIDNAVVPIEVSSNANAITHAIKVNQQRAIITLFLILVLINLSSVPSVTAYTITMLGVRATPFAMRLAFVSGYLNSVANPIIICTRTQDIKIILRKLLTFRQLQE